MARYGVRGRAAKSGSARFQAAAPGRRPAEMPRLYRGAKSGRAIRDIYASEHGDQALGGRFRWLVSTCLAGAIGALAIVVVIYGSADPKDSDGGLLPALKRMSDELQAPPAATGPKRDDGLKWSVPRADKLEVTSGATSTRYIIHETLKEKRSGREYIYAKPYLRMMLRMAPVPTGYEDVIPPFNPFKLYGNSQPAGARDEDQEVKSQDVSVRVVELLGGILPGEDGQELDQAEVTEIVEKSGETTAPAASEIGPSADGAANNTAEPGSSTDTAEPAFTTVLQKTAAEDDISDELEGLKRIIKTAADGDTITKVLISAGASNSLARTMIDAGREVFPDSALKSDYEVHIVVAPTLADPNRLEPVRFSVFDEGHAHKISVARSAAGEFVASADPIDDEAMLRAAAGQGSGQQLSSLYSSLYAAALMQQIPSSTITQILTTHAYDADFKRRIRPGDSLELFFDLKDDLATEGTPGDLLYTALTTGGDTKKFYRYRTPDGATDFYDDSGSNARRFLMRQAVRSEEARITSGFGVRFHPLLNERKMHTGVDWAAPTGTPIMAAGNGTIEEAGRKGQYGNYIRIRHANGYQTAYGHMSRIVDGVVAGMKIRQGQTIGFVGSTGLSSGPHLHFEVLVNNQFVNPTSIQAGNEKQLKDKEFEDFQRERARIEDLKARPPVATSTKTGTALNK